MSFPCLCATRPIFPSAPTSSAHLRAQLVYSLYPSQRILGHSVRVAPCLVGVKRYLYHLLCLVRLLYLFCSACAS